MMSSVLVDKVSAFVTENDLFFAPCRVLLGLSGGADSMALLNVLMHWNTPLEIYAVHIHHGLREHTADRDETFVRQYCHDYGIPLTVIRANVAAVSKDRHLTLEEAGRQVRYAAFEQVRQDVGADVILTAHHADDQIETVLMHLIRGCGVDGLSGIPARRGCICRPLLGCTRAEIEAYCADHQIPYVVDETNEDMAYTRNQVRHQLLPLLRQMNPSVGEALLRLSRHANDDAIYLNDQADVALSTAQCSDGYRADVMATQPAVIRRRMIRHLLRRPEISSIEESHVMAADAAVKRHHGYVSLPNGYVFSVEQGIVSIRENDRVIEYAPVTIDSLPKSLQVGGFLCSIYERYDDAVNVHNLLVNSTIDYDKIFGELCLRSRLGGDYIHPGERGVGKSLKKMMNEWRIPTHLRDTYPLLCDDLGVVLVPGYGCDERVRVTANTKHYLVCDAQRVQG